RQLDADLRQSARPHRPRVDLDTRADDLRPRRLHRSVRHVDTPPAAGAVVAPPARRRLRVVELLAQELQAATITGDVVAHCLLLGLAHRRDLRVALGVIGPRLAGSEPTALHASYRAVN